MRGRVVGADRKSGVAGATVYVDGWPLAKSTEDGTFEIPHASESWREISAAIDGRFGIRTRGTEGDVVLALSTPASVAGLVSSEGVVRAPVSAGTYTVRVSSSGYASRVIQAQAPSQEIRVAMTPGGSLVIDSGRSTRVSARLIDASGADYTAGYYMGTMPLSPGENALSNVAPGSYTLQVLDAAGAVESSVPVTVREGQVTDVRI